ncbi:hypothetical protein JX265_009420 [Neoarthrinium moseri]|uniref:Mannan endo-1,6-alpha-mannosidase n=1 Tax=Neoarthrinium moseri TaxID=1658444 RepID=A0A9P9WGI1_9PEZI|nr:hypothetical protein JX266_011988 [Neoarthrinium moseri]KAI1861917.1 hypothetical protein JX265_009420 [Neoarthrinium moseri]
MSVSTAIQIYRLLACILLSGYAVGTGIKEAAAALNGLMLAYDDSTGLWDLSDPDAAWWQSSVALQATLDFMTASGTREHLPYANYTINMQRAPLAWWPQGGGDFRAESTDDTGWWALAMTSMYTLTGERSFLDIALEDEAYMAQYWTLSECNGGLIWRIQDVSYKAAISNELYIELTATLHNLIPWDTTFLNRSLDAWDWFKDSGMINSGWLINDGLTKAANDSCINNNAPTWTYNQGVVLGGLVQLYLATGDAQFLIFGRNIAGAVLASAQLSPGGILTEPCPLEGCPDGNAASFKGLFIRNLAKLNAHLPDRPYSLFLSTNANTMYVNARSSSAGDTDLYGMLWQGPFDKTSIGRQQSAVMLLVAALGV